MRPGGNTATGKILQKSRRQSILKSSDVARWNPDSPWFVSKCVGLEPKLLVRSLPWTSDKVVFLCQCWLMKRFGSTVGEARKVSTSSTITVQWAAPADNGCPMTGWPTESLWIAVAAGTCYWILEWGNMLWMNGDILLMLHVWWFVQKHIFFSNVILVALVWLVLMFSWITPHMNLDESCGQLYLVLDSLAFHEFVQCRYRLYMDENQDGVAEQDIYPGFDDLTCFLSEVFSSLFFKIVFN